MIPTVSFISIIYLFAAQGPHDSQVPLLNTVAAVVGAYFGQDAEMLSLLGPDTDVP